jgi:hypothetical protein
MTKTASNAPGVVPAAPPLAPYLTVSDARAAIAFYRAPWAPCPFSSSICGSWPPSSPAPSPLAG